MLDALKSNLRKILIIGIVIVVVGVGLAVYFIWSGKEVTRPVSEFEPRTTSVFTPEEAGAGLIGEVSKEEMKEKNISPRPPAIFSTIGTILNIKENDITIKGNGSNFADGQSRELKLIFTEHSIVFEKGQTKHWQGSEGLNHFEVGERIFVSSNENIRGKIEFKVDYINKM